MSTGEHLTAEGTVHVPVLVSEVLEALAPRPGGRYVDGTVGSGGHASALLDAAPRSRMLALDRDPEAVARAQRRLALYGDRVTLVHASFERIAEVTTARGFARCDGILLDLGLSSDQLADPRRGFSFQSDGPLDMRFDPATRPTAAELLAALTERELVDILRNYGDERKARRIARSIVAAGPIETTAQLAAVVSRAAPGRHRRIHPATRTFQALRIAVNDELTALKTALEQIPSLLSPGGRLAVISFHSIEDRIVKNALRTAAADCICPPELPECRCEHRPTLRLVTRRPIMPSAAEIEFNPRARSARLRVAERTDNPAPPKTEIMS